jgi:flagellar L-ring protein FlgH
MRPEFGNGLSRAGSRLAAVVLLVSGLSALGPSGAFAQTSPAPGGSPTDPTSAAGQAALTGQPGQTPANPAGESPAGSVPGQPAAAQPSVARPPARASWLSDRASLRVGDVLMVVIDEQTTAREFSSRLATADRSTDATLRARANGEDAIGQTGVQAGLKGDSRDIGETNRAGDLIATLSARVTSIDESGNAHIEGMKKVVVDGREQEVSLTGTIRPDDVPSTNIIHSSRIADALFSYKGKKIGPRQSFFGRILSMLWP